MTGILALVATPAHAQEGSVVLEGGVVRALPTADLVGVATTYAIGGLRLEWSGVRGVLVGGGYGGRARDGTAFVSGIAGGEIWLGPAAPLGAGLGGTLQGFQVDDLIRYHVTSAELAPVVRVGDGALQLWARGRFGAGSSVLEHRRTDGVVRRAERSLWSRGVDAELTWTGGPLTLMGVAGAHRSQAGRFRRAGARIAASVGPVTVRVDAGVWDTPLGDETVGEVSLTVPLGPVATRASAGRTVPDPLTQVEAGIQTGVMLGLRVLTFGRRAALVHEVVEAGSPSRVRIRVALPEARTVSVLGDFGGWAPLALGRDGEGWSVELAIEPGVYHFGFLVDGEWWVPEGLQGNVPDEWGRMNATMVVPDREQGL